MHELGEEIRRVLEHYQRHPVQVELCDTPLKIGSNYSSCHFRDHTDLGVILVDGERTNVHPQRSQAQGVRVQVYMGDSPKGHSAVEVSLNGVGTNPRVVGITLDTCMDDVLKIGAKKFLSEVGNGISSTKADLVKNGKRRRVDYQGPEGLEDTVIEEIERVIAPWTREVAAETGARIGAEISVTLEKSLFVDTLGSTIQDSRLNAQVGITLQGVDSKGRDFGYAEAIYLTDPNQLQEKVLDSKRRRLVEGFNAAKDSFRVTSGEYAVLLDGAAVATMVHEAIAAHLLSGKYVAESLSSVYGPGRLGEKILPGHISIIDDPTIEGGFGSYTYDEQGIRAERVVLVENGVLRTYLLDLQSAERLSLETNREFDSNGRARSEWTQGPRGVVELEPRVTNLHVGVSEDVMLSEEAVWENFYEQIRASGRSYGIFVEGGDGHVDVQTGLFTIMPGAAWRVDLDGNREFLDPISLSGNAKTFFENSVAGAPYRTGYGFCGASSGSVPTQHRAPMFLIPRLEVVDHGADDSTERLTPRLYE